MASQFDNEFKTLVRKLEADQAQLLKAVPGSDMERMFGNCVAVRAKTLISFIKEHHPEYEGE